MPCTPTTWLVLYASHEDPLVALRLLQEDLISVGNWCLSNYMTINTAKSMVMYFGTACKIDRLADPVATLCGQVLPFCHTYPYLGIELDSKLTIKPHINKVKKSFGNKNIKLTRLRKCMTKDVSLALYKVMISPSVEYCSFYSGSALKTELDKLQRMQNQALRTCLQARVREISIIALHKQCGAETLSLRRSKQLLCIMWKKANRGEAMVQRDIRTRGDLKVKFAKRRAKSAFYERSPYYRAVTIWDKLHHTTQKLPTYKKFKTAINKLNLD